MEKTTGLPEEQLGSALRKPSCGRLGTRRRREKLVDDQEKKEKLVEDAKALHTISVGTTRRRYPSINKAETKRVLTEQPTDGNQKSQDRCVDHD